MPKLYVIPTPIGNLGDITLRAIDTLKKVDFILAEDTRTTGLLLKHFQIQKKLFSYHQHNEHKILERYTERILHAESAALVTDAGTPGISDPGFLIIRECLKNDIEVECLPGPTAIIPALVQSGIPCDQFVFCGFLPLKKGRMSLLKSLSEEKRTLVFYESPHRLTKTLEQMIGVFGPGRQASVARELTKKFEENARGTLEEILTHFSESEVKGELVIVVSGK
jgi:16S rRNA (cytidine1402-2'-O)-methyltransferase